MGRALSTANTAMLPARTGLAGVEDLAVARQSALRDATGTLTTRITMDWPSAR